MLEIQAYHIRTEEQRSPGLCLDIRTLDSLFVYDEYRMLLGYTPEPENKRKGEIWCYQPFSLAYRRAIDIINGTLQKDQPVLGKIIKELQLDHTLLEKISRNYRPPFRKCEPVYNITGPIELPWDYEGSTKQLLAILSGDFKHDKSRRKRIREPAIQRIPILQLQPVPSF